MAHVLVQLPRSQRYSQRQTEQPRNGPGLGWYAVQYVRVDPLCRVSLRRAYYVEGNY